MNLKSHRPETSAEHGDVSEQITLPPPDPWTRVELVSLGEARTSHAQARRYSGDVLAAGGIGGLLVAAAFVFVRVLDPPSLSETLIVSVIVLFALVSMVLRRRAHSKPQASGSPAIDGGPVADGGLVGGGGLVVNAGPVVDGKLVVDGTLVVDGKLVVDDVPSLIGQIGVVLATLRQEHGVAYSSHTWVEAVLPIYGAALVEAILARDLLAIAALDAGGIRADVANLAETRTREAIVYTCHALLTALQHMHEACGGSSDWPAPPPSDPSRWPATAC